MDMMEGLDPSNNLGVFFFCFFAGLSFFVNAEATVVVATTQFELHPIAAAFSASFGQAFLYYLLYRFGNVLTVRWGWLQRQVKKIREKYAERLEERFLILVVFAGAFGIPPLTGMAAIAPGFHFKVRTFLVLAVPLRFLRFLVLGAFSQELASLWARFFGAG